MTVTAGHQCEYGCPILIRGSRIWYYNFYLVETKSFENLVLTIFGKYQPFTALHNHHSRLSTIHDYPVHHIWKSHSP